MVVAMSEVNELTPSPDGIALEPLAADELDEAADELGEVVELVELVELQAAAVRAMTAATIDIDPSRRKRRNAPPPCRSKYGPLFSDLLPSLIPYPPL
jgi:hypothetical protein